MDYPKISISIILIIIYLIIFGKVSIEKYLDGGVLINQNEKRTLTIDPPVKYIISISISILQLSPLVIALYTFSPTTYSAWKWKNWTACEDKVTTKDVKDCFNENGYMLNETILEIHGNASHFVKTTLEQGFVHFLQPAAGSIQFSPANTFRLKLNHSMGYYISIMDPKYQIITAHPTATPQTFIEIEQNSGVKLIYLKVSGA